ncbi:MAG: YwiC-like family protein [Acidobacteria bacterium]|nr:YwiC-like family protein [Acidobacteriota bacterium]
MSEVISTVKVRTRGIALPNEHGAWGFLFEPLVVALAIAFSMPAAWIALTYVGAFLMRQPLKVYVADRIAGRDLPQTSVALKFALYFGLIYVVGVAGSLAFADLRSFIPILLVAPLGVYQIYADASKQSRNLVPELTGAVAISSSITVIALASGFEAGTAYALWGVFAARLIPSIVYVRNRLRLEKGKDYLYFPAIFAHVAGIACVALLAVNGLIPKLPLVIFSVLLIRAAWGLSSYRKKVKAMRIGIWEVIYGALTAISVILGYYFGI